MPRRRTALPPLVLLPQVGEDVDEIVVGLVVVSAHAGVPVVIAEPEQQRGEVVGEVAVVHPCGEQRVPHGDVREERG